MIKCVVLGIMLSSSGLTSTELVRSEHPEVCNRVILENLDRYDDVRSHYVNDAGEIVRPLGNQRVRVITGWEGVRAPQQVWIRVAP